MDARFSEPWKAPSLEAPSPKKSHRHAVAALQLGGQGRAGGQGHSRAHDAVGAQHADAEVGDVHRAALAVAVAVAAAEKLGHHQVDVGALGDGVAVAAVGAGDAVGRPQGRADAHRHRFFADVGVDHSGYVAFVELLHRPLVEGADGHHLAVHVQQQTGIEGHSLRLRRLRNMAA